MARRLILDTGVLVASERAQMSWRGVLEADDDVAIAVVTVAELRTGVELAGAGRRDAREAFLEQVLATIPVEHYALNVDTSTASCWQPCTAAGPSEAPAT